MPDASVDVGTVRQRFNFDWAMSEPVDGLDTYWWWARSIRIDPNEVIADDGEGNIWSVPFTTDGEDAVTFGDPVRVRETYVPVTAGEGATATAVVQRRRQRTLAAQLERPSKPTDASHPSHPAASERPNPEEDQTMTIDLDALRTRLGLPEDAGEEQINEALANEPEATITEEQVTERVETAVAAAREEERQRASASAPTAEHLAALREQAELGAAARAQQLDEDRTKFLAEAVRAGRIPPAASASYRTQLDQGGDVEKATREFITGLPEATVPVVERGSAKTDDDPTAAAQGTGLFPDLDDKKEA